MVVGATGCGKSTIMNALIQGVEKMNLNAQMNIEATDQLEYNGHKVFEIGHKNLACTEYPGLFDHNGICFVDSPGLHDTDIHKQYSNQTFIHQS